MQESNHATTKNQTLKLNLIKFRYILATILAIITFVIGLLSDRYSWLGLLVFSLIAFACVWLATFFFTPTGIRLKTNLLKHGKLSNKFVVIIGLICGFIGGFVGAFSGGLAVILYDAFNIIIPTIVLHISFSILFNGIVGTILGKFGANLGIKRNQRKETSILRQILVAIIWGLAFGFIPNIFTTGSAS